MDLKRRVRIAEGRRLAVIIKPHVEDVQDKARIVCSTQHRCPKSERLRLIVPMPCARLMEELSAQAMARSEKLSRPLESPDKLLPLYKGCLKHSTL